MTHNIDDVEEVTSIVPVKKNGVESKEQPRDRSLDSIYDHYQKKLYVIDCSGSMSGGMAPEDEQLMYKWTPEILQQFRDRHKADLEDAVNAGMVMPDEAAAEMQKLADDQELIRAIIAGNWIFEFGIDPERDWGYARFTKRKIEAVRGAMKNFVEQRFQKYPDAQVGLFSFGTSQQLLAYAGNTKEIVLQAIAQLSADAGGTDIMGAVRRAMNEMKARPSRVGAHHIVLVTDGQDHGALDIDQLLPDFKKMNIVLDFILVLGEHGGSYGYEEVTKKIKAFCEATGGEYFEVRKETDFEQKFLKVSNRPALPPARS